MSSDSYNTSAKYYDDAYAAVPELVDLPFYLDLAKKIGGPVLEMAVELDAFYFPSRARVSRFMDWTVHQPCCKFCGTTSHGNRLTSSVGLSSTKATCEHSADNRNILW